MDELRDLIALGNEGAPQEWLDHLTGEGVGGGYEGAHGEEMESLMEEGGGCPELPIQATPEMAYLQCSGANYTPGRGGCPIEWIVIHYTAGSVTAEGAANANCRYFAGGSRGASAHYFVDDGYTIWQSVAECDTAWAVGVWSLNQRSISIEVCSAGAFTEAEIARLAWLVHHLMAKYGIGADHIIRHYDCNGKHCPAYYVDESRWQALRKRITAGGSGQEASKGKVDKVQSVNAKGGTFSTVHKAGGHNGKKASEYRMMRLASSIEKYLKLGYKRYGKAFTIKPGGTVPVYRLRNSGTGDEMFCTSLDEAKSCEEMGYTYLGVPFIAPKSGKPMYRLYAPKRGMHRWTPDVAERDRKVKAGWTDEGVAFCVDSVQ